MMMMMMMIMMVTTTMSCFGIQRARSLRGLLNKTGRSLVFGRLLASYQNNYLANVRRKRQAFSFISDLAFATVIPHKGSSVCLVYVVYSLVYVLKNVYFGQGWIISRY